MDSVALYITLEVFITTCCTYIASQMLLGKVHFASLALIVIF
ncbi:hypothetical protein [Vibrio sp. TBV020]